MLWPDVTISCNPDVLDLLMGLGRIRNLDDLVLPIRCEREDVGEKNIRSRASFLEFTPPDDAGRSPPEESEHDSQLSANAKRMLPARSAPGKSYNRRRTPSASAGSSPCSKISSNNCSKLEGSSLAKEAPRFPKVADGLPMNKAGV